MWNKLLKTSKVKDLESDDFIKRIRSLVIGEGMLKEGNISLMDYAIKNLPEHGSVLEIGSYGGLSTNLMIYLMRKYKKTIRFLLVMHGFMKAITIIYRTAITSLSMAERMY